MLDLLAQPPAIIRPASDGFERNQVGVLVPKKKGGTVFVPFAAPVSAGAPPLDGLSGLTCALSMSRDLLTSWGGGPLYTNVSGAVSQWNDQSGAARNFTNGTAGARPAVATAGPKSRACADFDGTDDFLNSTAALSGFITASAGYVIASVYIDTFGTNNSTNLWENDSIWCSQSNVNFAAVPYRSTGAIYAWGWDGSSDAAASTITASAVHVVEWRHESGNIYIRVDAGSWVSAAHGNTSDLTKIIGLGVGSNPSYADIKIFEWASLSTVPTSGQMNALAANMLAWIN